LPLTMREHEGPPAQRGSLLYAALRFDQRNTQLRAAHKKVVGDVSYVYGRMRLGEERGLWSISWASRRGGQDGEPKDHKLVRSAMVRFRQKYPCVFTLFSPRRGTSQPGSLGSDIFKLFARCTRLCQDGPAQAEEGPARKKSRHQKWLTLEPRTVTFRYLYCSTARQPDCI
jgi:hypothetical protein